jgi:molybdopterin molybdotransferase
MISVQEATKVIFDHVFPPESTVISITEAVGHILDEDIRSDRDLPPFDRVTMDGIAIPFKTWAEGKTKFKIENLQAAGQPQKALTDPANAIEVMTGSTLPAGTDTVVRYEDIVLEKPFATITLPSIERGQSIHRKGQDAVINEVLLTAGMKLSPAEIALLASVGKSTIRIRTFPTTAIVSTGDELIDIDQSPLPHQIRKSNSYALNAALRQIGCSADLFHFNDNESALRKELGSLLEKYPVIILSGGVSQGKFDFIPKVLEELGVKKKFHQVTQRPGKPLWFGASQKNTVFALPGNPVSTFMCFYRYIYPWIMRSLGTSVTPMTAILAKDFSFAPKLTYFLQVGVKTEMGKLIAYPDAGGGSGDFANLKQTDGFLELPADRQDFRAGEAFPFIPFRH